MNRSALTLALGALLLGACDSDGARPRAPVFKAVHGVGADPAMLPFPNDVWFEGSSDGTLDVPVADPARRDDPLNALNALDGFSISGRIAFPFSGDLDATHLGNAALTDLSVLFVELEAGAAGGVAARRVLQAGVDHSLGAAPGTGGPAATLQVRLLRPLAPGVQYAIVLRNPPGIGAFQSVDGRQARRDDDFDALIAARAGRIATPARLSGVRALLDPVLDLVNEPIVIGGTATPAFEDEHILAATTFRTLSAAPTLASLEATVGAGPIALDARIGTNRSLLDPAGADPGLRVAADAYAGRLAMPYFLDRADVRGGSWKAAGGAELGPAGWTPIATTTLEVPLLVMVPNGGVAGGSAAMKPAGGWPVAVFVHDLGGHRAGVLELAQAFADAGVALAAVDLPLHGLPPGHPLHGLAQAVPVAEPTFDADLSRNADLRPGADGAVDASGQNFIVLESPLTTRDNLRQAVVGIMRLARSLPALDYDGVPGGDFGAGAVRVVGQGLGATVAALHAGVSDAAPSYTLTMPATSLFEMVLRDSVLLAPRYEAGFLALGRPAGSDARERYVQVAQAAVDAADPLGFGATLARPGLALHFVRFNTSPVDPVIPFLSTIRLFRVLPPLDCVLEDQAGAAPLQVLVRPLFGSHDSLLARAGSSATTDELQRQAATFAASGGSALDITDPTLLAPRGSGGDTHGMEDCI